MISKLLRALLPPLLIAVILSSVFVLPREESLVESSISPDLPLQPICGGSHLFKFQPLYWLRWIPP